MPPTIGIIGLGLLGGAVARRLLEGGFAVAGFDLRPEARSALKAMGGRAVESASDLLDLPRLLLSLPDSDAVESVLDEIEPGLKGHVILDTTTGDPERTSALAERLGKKGIDYVDATVLGSSEQARAGDIILMAGGRPEAVEASADVFTALARRWFHVGPSGSGARMKLVVNLVLGLNRAVLAEGLSFARRCGLDLRSALEILLDGAAYSRVMDAKGEKMLTGDFTPQARLAQHLKDVRLILDQARRVGTPTPLSSVHEELLSRVVEMGGGDEDNSAVIRAYEPKP
jgi:3-hydroxyisobutyrate dehydrogenase-like beta-hydroxyacid dehydrogenase